MIIDVSKTRNEIYDPHQKLSKKLKKNNAPDFDK
jgi:hypothetical protein